VYKQSVIWNNVTEIPPPKGRDLLVWTGSYMIVADADYYDEKSLKDNADIVNSPHLQLSERDKLHFLNCKGRFVEFGKKHYFDNPKVWWSELPLAPGEHNPPYPDPFEGMISKDAYLKKDGVIVGIHAIGHPGLYEWVNVAADGTETKHTSDFMQMEIWGNEYDENHQMLGRGSFRVFDHFENEVRNWEADGWVRYEGPKKVTK
jgi:hypothetical protein